MSCDHLEFTARVGVGRVTDDHDPAKLLRLTVEVMVECSDCGRSLQFVGLPEGIDTHAPTMSVDGLEARLVAVLQGDALALTDRVSAHFRAPGVTQ